MSFSHKGNRPECKSCACFECHIDSCADCQIQYLYGSCMHCEDDCISRKIKAGVIRIEVNSS